MSGTSLNQGRLKNNNPSGDPSSAPRCGAKTETASLAERQLSETPRPAGTLAAECTVDAPLGLRLRKVWRAVERRDGNMGNALRLRSRHASSAL